MAAGAAARTKSKMRTPAKSNTPMSRASCSTPGTACCSDYRNRKAFVPDCLRLTLAIVEDVPWLPSTCAYRVRAQGRSLPGWHYLISGDRDAVHRVGVGVAGRVVSETEAGPLEHHIVEWGPPRLDLITAPDSACEPEGAG